MLGRREIQLRIEVGDKKDKEVMESFTSNAFVGWLGVSLAHMDVMVPALDYELAYGFMTILEDRENLSPEETAALEAVQRYIDWQNLPVEEEGHDKS